MRNNFSSKQLAPSWEIHLYAIAPSIILFLPGVETYLERIAYKGLLVTGIIGEDFRRPPIEVKLNAGELQDDG